MTVYTRLAAYAATALSLAVAGPVGAEEFKPEQKTEIEQIVREYLIANPDVVQEALQELDRRQAEMERLAVERAIAQESDTLFNSKRQFELGNPQGDITLVEFFDYNCGYCKRTLTDLLRLVDEDENLRVVLKEFPILGEPSIEAAQISIAANLVDPAKYAEFHQRLLLGRNRAGRDSALSIAEKVGYDIDDLTAAMESEEIFATINEVRELASSLLLTGTPAFVVGNDVIRGALGYSRLKHSIASIRDCGTATCL